MYESFKIFEENGVIVETFEGVKSLSFHRIFGRRAKYLKDQAYKRVSDLTKITNEAQ